jgi:hypothetical protein
LTKFDPYEWSELTMNNPRRIQRHLVKALAAGALLAAAALPLAIAGVAGAAGGTVTQAVFNPGGTNFFGQGASGTVTITGTGFAHDGGNVTVTSDAPGLTFTGGAESAATTATAAFASTAATVPGTYNITVTDDNGAATAATAFVTVDAAPTVTAISPTGISDGNGATATTITGTGFVGSAVTLTSTVNGTTLTVGTVTTTATSLSFNVTPTNSVTNGAATAGTYTVTVTNSDGGTVTTGGIYTVTAYGVSNVSPSAVPVVTTSAVSTPVTITGAGFEFGATVALTGAVCTGTATTDDAASISAATVTSPTTITATVTQAIAVGVNQNSLCGITVTNPAVIAGGNAATFSLAGAFGIGEASTVAPTITATSATTAIVPGSAASVLTLTGSGFSYKTTAAAFLGTSAVAAPAVTLTNTGANTGTAASFNLTVGNGAVAGPENVVATNTAAASAAFPAALTVSGPAIASQTPAGIAVGAAFGTVVTLTGTGFTNTTTGTVAAGGTGLAGVVSYVSPTVMNLTVTTPPTASTPLNPATVTLSQTVAAGVTVTSPAFSLTIDADPVVNAVVTYASTPVNDVGVGATGQVVTFHGTGFTAGATVGSFVNGAGTADPNVTATVTTVTPTSITAKIAIAAGDTNFADGYSVTNTDGGVAKVPAIAYPLLIGAGPTITAVSPTPVLAASTNAITITGTGFVTGAVVTATSNATCGTTTVVSATSITVSCTFGIAQTTASSLVVTNPDGGSATSAVVLPAATTVSKPPVTFRVTGAHGHAVAGKTVTLTISGSGFYGQPRITSSAAGTRVTVSKDTGHLLTIRVTTPAATKHRSYTFTIRLANGKTGRANYVA